MNIETEEGGKREEYAISEFPLHPTRIRRNPSQGHLKRPLSKAHFSISSEAPLLGLERSSVEGKAEQHPDKVQESEGKNPQRSAKAFEVWLAAKEKAREQAQLAAQAKAEESRRAAEAKERLRRDVLQRWTERCEARLQERRSIALRRQEMQQGLVETEQVKAQQREQLCKQYYQKWLRDKAAEREIASQWGLGRPRKQQNRRTRPFLSVATPPSPTKHRLTLSTFQVSIVPTASAAVSTRPKRS